MARDAAWTPDQIPDLAGRTAIVTGANSGLGFWTSLELARNGAHVVMACRNRDKAESAAAKIRGARPDAALEVESLDLSDLSSVEAFSKRFLERHTQLHILCNNAGVMALPEARTVDGFEMQFGTNHLGHFALTGRLSQTILSTPGSRIVSVCSTAHRLGRIRFDDLHFRRGYQRWAAYGQSKLANLLFSYELQRRLELAGSSARSIASHPGYASTELQAAAARIEGATLKESVFTLANRWFAQPAESGAWPSLFAATAPEARGGQYIGPGGWMEMWGAPAVVGSTARSRDTEVAERLWRVSEQLTGVPFAVG